jgi:hypothetical protein
VRGNDNIRPALIIIERNKPRLLSNARHLFRNHSINRVTMETGDDLLYRDLQQMTVDILHMKGMRYTTQMLRRRVLLRNVSDQGSRR